MMRDLPAEFALPRLPRADRWQIDRVGNCRQLAEDETGEGVCIANIAEAREKLPHDHPRLPLIEAAFFRGWPGVFYVEAVR